MLFAQALAIGASAATSFDCSSLSIGSSKFDLSALTGVHSFDVSTPTPPTVTKTNYAISLCSALPPPGSTEDDCPTGTYACMKIMSQRSGLDDRIISVVPVAGEIGSGDLKPVASLKEGEKGVNNGWILSMEGGSYNDVKQKLEIEMVCTEGAKGTAPTLESYEPKAGLLSLKWKTLSACPTSSSSPPSPPKDNDKTSPTKPNEPEERDTSWGFFGWFFTLFILSMIIYFVGGTYYNYSQYGTVEIPHKDIWKDLPYVVADIFKGRGGSRNGYSSLG